ncbi:response regulator transcription factor [Actinomadura graeca]|uniref:Response regulator transcription factor n=1 Tax=Actinomadura graeca TaxID=2750812 RepID=A0ABX8QRQ8_9ACTN|nr:response regulator transcription factor [Actinomadura graeca]QXJ20899.1 response regulator transcription factor [Actinomadura graeca]
MLVDDHDLVRQGIRALLEAHADIAVVAEAESADGAVAAADEHRPDIVVMDVDLGDSSGIEATREIRGRHAEIRVLMLTASDDQEARFSSILAGASGFVLKRIQGDELVTAIHVLRDGGSLIDPELASALLRWATAGRQPPLDATGAKEDRVAELSAQQNRVLALMAEGLTNKQIGAELNLTEKTVRNYVSSILGKLGLTGRAQAAVYFVRRGSGQV